MTLFITYDNETLQDGLGAQALRITGIYAIAKALGIRYIHSPILAAIEDVSHNLPGDSQNTELVSFFNSFFSFPSTTQDPNGALIIDIRTLSIRELTKVYVRYVFSRKKIILKVLLPMAVLDKCPRLYEISAIRIRALNERVISAHTKRPLVAHVRRGYDEKYANTKYTSGRHLPFSYFSDALKTSVKLFRIPKGSVLTIHTDLVNKQTIWRPKQQGVLDGFRRNSGQEKSDGIKLEGYDLEREIETPSGYSLEVHYCDPLVKTFLDMCTAEVFIQGRSALSYLAGIINPNKVLWPEVQSHSRLPRWYSSSKIGVRIRDRMLG
jgi:hypothetical protein